MLFISYASSFDLFQAWEKSIIVKCYNKTEKITDLSFFLFSNTVVIVIMNIKF